MGYWTYHETHRGSYCCGPCCITGLLMLPFLPVINGFFIVKDTLNPNPPTHIETTVADIHVSDSNIENI